MRRATGLASGISEALVEAEGRQVGVLGSMRGGPEIPAYEAQ